MTKRLDLNSLAQLGTTLFITGIALWNITAYSGTLLDMFGLAFSCAVAAFSWVMLCLMYGDAFIDAVADTFDTMLALTQRTIRAGMAGLTIAFTEFFGLGRDTPPRHSDGLPDYDPDDDHTAFYDIDPVDWENGPHVIDVSEGEAVIAGYDDDGNPQYARVDARIESETIPLERCALCGGFEEPDDLVPIVTNPRLASKPRIRNQYKLREELIDNVVNKPQAFEYEEHRALGDPEPSLTTDRDPSNYPPNRALVGVDELDALVRFHDVTRAISELDVTEPDIRTDGETEICPKCHYGLFHPEHDLEDRLDTPAPDGDPTDETDHYSVHDHE